MSSLYDAFYEALGFRGSSSNYTAENGLHYIGKYQMGEGALMDVGLISDDGTVDNVYGGDWNILLGFGVTSVSDFKASPEAQEWAVRKFASLNWKTIRNLGLDEYVGQTIGGIVITPSGMLAAAHNQGVGGLQTFLQSNGATDPTDGNGTHISDYMDELGGFWVPHGMAPVPGHKPAVPSDDPAQAFDEGTIERLRRLSVAVIGASGTGSPTVEQLVRLGVGEIILVDDDTMEDRNVNRILNSTMDDAKQHRHKVDVLADSIERLGLGTKVIRIKKNLWDDPETIRKVAQCDAVFGCMDTVDGRYLLNRLATYYLLPYFDIGIRLVADPDGPNKGRIREVCGTVHYLRPGRSSLMSRGLFTMEQVAAAGLRRTDPEAHAQQVKDGYIAGVAGNRPAVISVNMFASSLAVSELLARLHPYREEPNMRYASVEFSLASMELICDPDEGICPILGGKVGLGDTKPLLGMIEFAARRAP